jgi:hypothetical protein
MTSGYQDKKNVSFTVLHVFRGTDVMKNFCDNIYKTFWRKFLVKTSVKTQYHGIGVQSYRNTPLSSDHKACTPASFKGVILTKVLVVNLMKSCENFKQNLFNILKHKLQVTNIEKCRFCFTINCLCPRDKSCKAAWEIIIVYARMRFSNQHWWRSRSPGMWHWVNWKRVTNILEELAAFVFRVVWVLDYSEFRTSRFLWKGYHLQNCVLS